MVAQLAAAGGLWGLRMIPEGQWLGCFFSFFNNFIYLFIDCPGCSFCCAGLSLVALSGGYPLVVGCGLLAAVASPVAGHRVQVKGLQ